MLRNIPQGFDIDKSVFGPFLNVLGSVDKETAYKLVEEYSRYPYGKRFIRHNGVIYSVDNQVD